MVLLVVAVLSVVAALVGYLVVRHWPKADPALSASESIGAKLRNDPKPRNFLRSRLDPATATGLVLTAALIGIVVTGTVVGLFAWMIRRDLGVVTVDLAVERWAEARATAFTDGVLGALTHLGDTETILGIGIAVGAYGFGDGVVGRYVVCAEVVLAMLISKTSRSHRPSPHRCVRVRTLHGHVLPRYTTADRPPTWRLPSSSRSAARRRPAPRSPAPPLRSASLSGAPGCSWACISSRTRWPGSRSACRGSVCARWRSGAGC